MQVANVFQCRSERASAFASGLFGNWLIWAGVVVALALILLIDSSSLGNRLFGTAPIGSRVWLFVLPFAAGMFALEELRKWSVCRAGRRIRRGPPVAALPCQNARRDGDG